MASELYSDMREDLKPFADFFEEQGFRYEIHQKGVLINVYDLDGIKQTYYTTTGNARFYKNNDEHDYTSHFIKNISLDVFVDYLQNPDEIQKFF